jgi:hypothetical protein
VPVEDGNIALLTLGAASVAAVAPIISLLVTWLIRSREKTVQWAREDLVAAKAAAANKAERERQEAVARKAAEAASLLLAAQDKTSQQNADTQDRLKEIHTLSVSTHTLVNSNLTREMDERLVALKGQAILLKRIGSMEPSDETTTSLLALQLEIGHLETLLTERGTALKRADNEQT